VSSAGDPAAANQQFGDPPPKPAPQPLTPWEQLAQVLLESNEFFVRGSTRREKPASPDGTASTLALNHDQPSKVV
jgi:hypothetical protein